jgi:DnaJ domain
MFIVWRQRPIKNDRKVELFTSYSNTQVLDITGKVLKTGRHKDGCSLDGPAWHLDPIYCTHRGPGRVAWIPALVHAERIDGKPRQKLLRRLPGIRSCCIDDRFIRAAWWQAIDDLVRFWEEAADGQEGQFFARDRKAMLTKLREVVPRPTRAGLREFTAYRLKKEAEQKRTQDEVDASWGRQAEEQRRRAEEQRRKIEEKIGPPAPCWAVLGLAPPPATTMEMLKKRYRELAKQHHPDRNSGNDGEFKRMDQAYEEGKKILSGV